MVCRSLLSLFAVLPLLHAAPIAYPASRTDGTVDELHGVVVKDPYRWLEDDNAKETEEWVAAQNKVTHSYLAQIPEREGITRRLTELWNYERQSTPYRVGDRYFFWKNNGLQNQSVLYTMKTLDEEPVVLLDPNTLSEDGTVAVSSDSVSDDGKLLAYSISRSGSDWREWKVRNVETGKDLDDLVQWSKFSGAAWSKDNKGFYYSRYDEPAKDAAFQSTNHYQKVYYHQLGEPQSKDTLIYERKDQKEWGFSAFPTEDGRYLLIHISRGTDSKNGLFYKYLKQKDAPVVELFPEFDASYEYVHNEGSTFWIQTDSEAPRKRVVRFTLDAPGKDKWVEVIPQVEETLKGVRFVGGKLVASYMKDAHSKVVLYDLEGTKENEIDLPRIGSANGFFGKKHHTETFYSFNSFTQPSTIYRYDFATKSSTLFWKPKLAFESADYETKQIFYTSKDGTRVPMFITHKKGLKLDGQNPTLLYGYGGFDISLQPRFSSAVLGWLELGGVYALANLRGGGEYGEEWHQAGMKHRKQNVFDDFIAAGEWLISQNYTSSEKLAIAGGSNGGLLVGACMVQRPELFKAALPAVGVMDMLRFHKFTIGWAWAAEYGSPENEEDFKTLYAYSPYHNLKKGVRYPSTMVITADHDDRVVPAHSFKFAAALQASHEGENPVLIRIETKAGHGAGKPTAKRIAEAADKWAFLVKELGLEMRNQKK